MLQFLRTSANININLCLVQDFDIRQTRAKYSNIRQTRTKYSNIRQTRTTNSNIRQTRNYIF